MFSLFNFVEKHMMMMMATPKNKIFGFCSMLMAFLFAYSASVQFNDPDWYFWFPLYAFACVVNLIHGVLKKSSLASKKIAKVALGLGFFLFVKVVVEDFVSGIVGFWSLDLRERVVREKIGSGLAVISIFLQLEEASPPAPSLVKKKKNEVSRFVEYGMAALVGISYGIPLVFFVIQKGEMKF